MFSYRRMCSLTFWSRYQAHVLKVLFSLWWVYHILTGVRGNAHPPARKQHLRLPGGAAGAMDRTWHRECTRALTFENALYVHYIPTLHRTLHRKCTRADIWKCCKDIAADEKYDYLIIEATGVAEPLPIAQTFAFKDRKALYTIYDTHTHTT